MNERKLTLETSGGPMCLHLAMPEGSGKKPGILVFQEAFGVNGHIREVCRRFAAEGFVAAAPEFFHRLGEGVVFGYDEFPKIRPLLGGMTNAMLLEDARVAADALARLPEVDATGGVSAVGYCMGGFISMLLASHYPLKIAVSFYGGGMTEPRPGIAFSPILDDFSGIRSPVRLGFGGQDHGISTQQVGKIRERLASLNKDFEIVTYEAAGHGFMCDDRPSYHEVSARDAWVRTLGWLRA